MPIFYLSDKIVFPPAHLAEREGLLAVGGDLSVKRLLGAYEKGIFPWYMAGEPILWWSPDPRLVLYPREFHISRSLQKIIHKKTFRVTADRAFEQVICECAETDKKNRNQTWLVDDMKNAYIDLHGAGYAHSIETWHQDRLAGGLYGVALGGCFFGESMFTRVSNASKAALVHLVGYLTAAGFDMIDCQIATAHLKKFGAREIPRTLFLQQLDASLKKPTGRKPWNLQTPPDE